MPLGALRWEPLCASAIAPCTPELQAVEIQVDDRRGVQRQQLAQQQTADWTCSHDTGHIWEEILPHPSESMSRTLKDLERQAFAVFWGMIRLSH